MVESTRNYVLVVVGLGEGRRLCSRGFAFGFGILGILLCLTYLLIFTIPHSLWVTTLSSVDRVPLWWKKPGFLMAQAVTGLEKDWDRMDRSQLSDAMLDASAQWCKDMGFNSTNTMVTRDMWPVINFVVDCIFMLGVASSSLLVTSCVLHKSRPKLAIALACPYLILTLLLAGVTFGLGIYLFLEFRSTTRQLLATVQGEHDYTFLLVCLGLTSLLAFFGAVSAGIYILDLRTVAGKSEKSKARAESVQRKEDVEKSTTHPQLSHSKWECTCC